VHSLGSLGPCQTRDVATVGLVRSLAPCQGAGGTAACSVRMMSSTTRE
jgi:hypothetical protein